jgi:hypothetical protein
MASLYFVILLLKILFVVHLKDSSFLPSADVKPMSNDLAHAVTLYCMFALPKSTLQSLCLEDASSNPPWHPHQSWLY